MANPYTTILVHLCAISTDGLGELPALLLQLLFILDLDPILSDYRKCVLIQASCISVEQNFHAIPQSLYCLLLGNFLDRRFLWEKTTENRDC